MSLVLRSNKAIKLNKISDKVNATPSLSMDFRDERYLVNGAVETDLTKLVTAEGVHLGGYDNTYVYRKKPDKTPIVTTDPVNFKKGLLSQTATGNYFVNSSKPVSQDVDLYYASTSQGLSLIHIYAYMEGSGSITVSRKSDGEVLGTVKEGEYFHYYTTAEERSARKFLYHVEVSGDVTYVSMFGKIQSANTMELIRIDTDKGVREGTFDTNLSIPDNVVSQVIKGGSYTFIIKVVSTHKGWQEDKLKVGNMNPLGIAALKNTTKGTGVYVANGHYLNNAATGLLSVYRPSATQIQYIDEYSPIPDEIVHAVTVTPTEIKWCMNGKEVQKISGGFTDSIESILLGEAVGWVGIRRYTKLIEQVYIYNKAFSDDELKTVTSLN